MATIYYTASSTDGFIADPDNSLSWLLTRDVDRTGPMGYDPFIANVGAMAMGSTTYDWILDHEQGRWTYAQPTWVFSSRGAELRRVDGDIRFIDGPVGPPHDEMLQAAGALDVWLVGGGDLVGQFADAGLLDEVIVYLAPVTLGAGAPLLPRNLDLRLEEVERNQDFVCARFSVA